MPIVETQPVWLKSVFDRKLAEMKREAEEQDFKQRIIGKAQDLHQRMQDLWFSNQNGGFEKTLHDESGQAEVNVKIIANDDSSMSLFVDQESVTVWPDDKNRMPRMILTDNLNGQLVEEEFDFSRLDQTRELLDHLRTTST